MLRIIVPFAFVCAVAGTTRADDTARCREILSAVKNRHDQYNPVYAKYTIQTVRTVYGNASSAGVEPADQRLFSKFRESRGT